MLTIAVGNGSDSGVGGWTVERYIFIVGEYRRGCLEIVCKYCFEQVWSNYSLMDAAQNNVHSETRCSTYLDAGRCIVRTLRFSGGCCEEEKEIENLQKRFLRNVKDSNEAEMSPKRTWSNVRWLYTERGNAEQRGGDGLENVQHLMSKQRFEEKFKDWRQDKERLELFRNEMRLYVLHLLVCISGYREEQGDGDGVNGSVVWLTELIAWIATAVTCFVGRERKVAIDKSCRQKPLKKWSSKLWSSWFEVWECL